MSEDRPPAIPSGETLWILTVARFVARNAVTKTVAVEHRDMGDVPRLTR